MLEIYVTILFVAFAGATVAVSCCVFPVYKLAVVGVTLTEATGIAATVIAEVAVLLPSTVVAVIVVVPAATAVTNP
ncbi:hypothetical protein D3C84_882490 [compost metagenome]